MPGPTVLATTMAPHNQQQQQQQQQQTRPQLRRAVYVHVSDLTSAYNIDHARLEEELKRVKSDRENAVEPKARVGPPSDMDAAGAQKRLQPPRGGYNLCLLVGSVQVVVDKFRVDGSRVRLAEVEVGDETGTVSLRARDSQIDLLTEISERKGAVVLRNATLELYQGRHIRLAVTKWGKLTPYPDQIASTPAPPSRMNNDRYFSLIDLSAVASEMAVFTQNDSYPSNRPNDYENTNPAANQRNRSGPGNRRTNTRGKSPAGSGGHHPMKQQQSYPEAPGGMLRYPGTLHNYGYAPPEAEPQAQAMYGYHNPRQRPQDPQQLMMHQQQFEMQQRHQQQHAQPQQQQQPMHQQIHYHGAGGSPERGGPSLAAPGAAPMLLSGVVNPASFDGHFAGGNAPEMAPQSQQRGFAVVTGPYGAGPPPASAAGGPPPPHGHPQAGSAGMGNNNANSPTMNPQAPTFDPMYRKGGGRK